MKQIFLILFLFLILFMSFHISALEENENQKIIYLDPGHGSQDGGCVRENILEKNLNLQIAIKIKIKLEENGYKVLLTRNDDLPLVEPYHKKDDTLKRVEMINSSNALAYLSIHINHFSNSKYYGAQVFYFNSLEQNELLAYYLQEALIKKTNTSRRIKKIDNLLLLKKVNIPGCLLECGFISNDIEFRLLQSERYHNLLAECVLEAFNNYLVMF